jgi:hypothetical protein
MLCESEREYSVRPIHGAIYGDALDLRELLKDIGAKRRAH